VPLLDDLPASMARTVAAWLPAVDEARYAAFLDMMVHYTRHSGGRLRHAAAVASEPAIRAFFAALAEDEDDHWRLAAADLAAFGRAPSAEPPDEVAAFERFWQGLDAGGGLGHLGALYVLERVGGHLQADAKAALGRLGLTKQQARFVLVHLEVDADHGARAEALVQAFGPRDEAALTRGADEAAAHWVAMHRRAFVG
jgi:heme oxygenase-like protein